MQQRVTSALIVYIEGYTLIGRERLQDRSKYT
jgi:hypothetical protein